MLLHLAVVPPPALVDEASALLRDLRAPAPARGGGVGRLLGRSRTTPAGPAPLDLLDPDLVLLPVTPLGNLTPRDARRLAAAVTAALAPLPRPVVRTHGGVALEPIGDDRVQVRLVGDEAGLRTVVSATLGAIEQVGIFCDRRVFRPLLPLARVNEATTEADLEAALAALDGPEGRPWAVDHVALLQRPADARTQPSRVVERIPVGAP
ncbi:hypothetical protein [Nocardioides sp. AX2bis]|uniref:hypothetical protein n=1 Tax=Nocardioides sp. AX2bis TaxID=2653157 RepID=UPI00135C1BCA|nr:hypothetical protein [Nocardioides sp. AX2bis]